MATTMNIFQNIFFIFTYFLSWTSDYNIFDVRFYIYGFFKLGQTNNQTSEMLHFMLVCLRVITFTLDGIFDLQRSFGRIRE